MQGTRSLTDTRQSSENSDMAQSCTLGGVEAAEARPGRAQTAKRHLNRECELAKEQRQQTRDARTHGHTTLRSAQKCLVLWNASFHALDESLNRNHAGKVGCDSHRIGAVLVRTESVDKGPQTPPLSSASLGTRPRKAGRKQAIYSAGAEHTTRPLALMATHRLETPLITSSSTSRKSEFQFAMLRRSNSGQQ